MNPIGFHIGSFEVRAYGIMIAVGCLLALYRAVKSASRYSINPDYIFDVGFFSIIAGIIGARVGFVLDNLSSYKHNWLEVLNIHSGGMSFFGGLVLGFIAGLIVIVIKRLSFWDMADLLAPSILLGYAIGRIGCFLNNCCWGCPTNLPWAVSFHPDGELPTPPSHPVQLYSTLVNLVLFFCLHHQSKNRKFKGQTFALFMMLHGIYRFFIEFFRAGTSSEYAFYWITEAQIAGIVLALIGITVYMSMHKRSSPIKDAGT